MSQIYRKDMYEFLRLLNFPKGQYVVTGGGALLARGIKAAVRDLDIVGVPELLDKLASQTGWQRKRFYRGWLSGRRCYQNGAVEVYSDQNYKNHRRQTEYLVAKAEIIGGFPFMDLEELASFKLALGREKDKKDILLILSYFADQLRKRERIPWSV